MKTEGKFEENDIREKGNPVIWLKNQENTDLISSNTQTTSVTGTSTDVTDANTDVTHTNTDNFGINDGLQTLAYSVYET